MHETGTLPDKDATIIIDGLSFTIVERSATRLDLIRVEPAGDETKTEE